MGYFAENLDVLPGLSHSFGEVSDTGKPSGLFFCAQRHGADVIEVGFEQEAGVISGDAMFTRTTRPIAVVTADCLPILVGSSKDDFVAAIHGGWKGLAAGVIENSFNAFHRAGVSLNDLQVAIGPAIQPCCYEVDKQLIEELEHVHGRLWRGRTAPWSTSRKDSGEASSHPCAPASHDEAWLDLTLYCIYLLEAAGLDRAQVQTVPKCTYCSDSGLGSYRRRSHQQEKKTFQYSWIFLA